MKKSKYEEVLEIGSLYRVKNSIYGDHDDLTFIFEKNDIILVVSVEAIESRFRPEKICRIGYILDNKKRFLQLYVSDIKIELEKIVL